MQYQVLARKWRPKNFTELVGQDATVRTLSNAFAQERLHHAYLFTGTRGVGKTTIARIIAKCLNCETGISATPCGTCNTCQAIDAGQFVDLIEVDAASRTKVEDTRELLDNVQYAPSQGRFKIYLIDEVHMLSGHSFNALLKTLEEPPEHVKFLLATTDPQKLPITVLSRCLQFHLKGIAPDVISHHLGYILTQEGVTFSEPALEPLANAANGSMRDALSLLDQAIAFSDANITSEAVQKLLGTTAAVDLYPLLDAVAAQNGAEVLEHITQLALQGVSCGQVLTDFLQLLHRITIAQIVPEAIIEADKPQILAYAEQLSQADVQLFYQIGLIGQRDLPYAPSARAGFEMVLLRMLCFTAATLDASLSKPTASTVALQKTHAPAPQKAKPAATKPAPATATAWSEIITHLPLGGMTKVLAQNCVLDKKDEHRIDLHIANAHASLANNKQQQQLQTALSEYYGHTIALTIKVQKLAAETPAKETARVKDEHFTSVKKSLASDPHVQSILDDFGGSLDENSIKTL